MKFFAFIVILFFCNFCNAQNYCIPAPSNGVNGHSITRVKLESLDTSFTGDVYQFIRDSVHHETCYLYPGNSYQITLKSGTHTTSTLAAWIDWNNDATLSQSEKLGEFVTTSAGQQSNISFTVPQNCVKGKLRLRVRASSSTSINACTSYSSGQILDFTVTTLDPFYEYDFYSGWELSSTGYYYIDGVSIGSIDNNKSGGADGPVYGDYSYMSTEVTACNTYYIHVNGNYSTDPNFISIYVDYNKNGLFEDVELLSTVPVPSGINSDSILFLPPSVTGVCRMRVIYSTDQQIIEVEDYSIDILNTSATNYPTAIIGSDLYYKCDTGCFYFGCPGANTFHDFSCGIPATRLWTVTGGSPSTSTSKNPTFNFPNPGTYNITLEVTNAIGTDIISELVHIRSPLATINLGSNTTLCSGDSMQLSAPAGTCYSYLWSTGATTRQIYVRNSGTYFVEVSSCNYYECPAYDTITVNFTPNVYNLTGGGNYCTGGNGSVIGLSDSQSGINYQLYLNGSPVDTPLTGTGNAISFGLQTQPGSYTIKATSTSPACTRNMNGSTNVNVISLPTAFTVNGGGSYCAGSGGVAVGLTNSENNVQYQLFRNGISVGTPVAGTGAPFSFPNHTTAGNYTVVGTGNNSTCSTPMIDTALISVIPAPSVFTVSGGGTFCGGIPSAKVTLSDSHIGDTYRLVRNGTPTGITLNGNDSALVFANLMQSGTYTIVASDSSSCTSNMSGSASLTIISTPFPYPLTGGGDFCNNTSLDSIILSGSDDWVRYQLYVDSTPVGNSLNGYGGSLNFGLQTAPGTYFVVGSHTISGCYLPMNGRPVISLNHGAPVSNVTGGGHYCTGGIGLPVGLNGSDTAFNYQLYLNGNINGSPLAGTGSAINFGVKNVAGNYTVVAFSRDSSCVTNMNDTAVIVIDPLPSPVITSSLPDTVCTFSSPIALTGSPPGGVFSGDGVVNDTLFPALAGPQTVFIYYDYTDPNTGCSTYASEVVLIDVCNSVFESIAASGVLLFPNPADNELVAEFKDENQKDFSIELMNETGRLVQKKDFKTGPGIFSYRLNLMNVQDGIYLVKVTSGKTYFCRKLIVIHN